MRKEGVRQPMTTTKTAGEREYEHFDHGADIGVRGFGPTQAAAFEEAARALTAVVSDPATIAARETIAIECAAPNADFLLLDFLNALIYAMATRAMLFAGVEVVIEDGRLRARASGEPIDPARHPLTVEVKGATLTELRVARQADGRWLAQCVVDV